MKLYHVEQSENNGYDTYSDFVVAAESEEVARNTHPNKYVKFVRDGKWYGVNVQREEYETENSFGSWVKVGELEKVRVKYIGEAAEGVEGIICSSFHAG